MKKSILYLYVVQIFVTLPSVIYWLDSMSWSLSGLTFFAVFPLLGLIAFSMMWLHLMVAYFKSRYPDLFDYDMYYRQTSHVVLALILLHPGMLLYEYSKLDDVFLDYAGDEGRPFIILGTLAFSIFMLYEVVSKVRESKMVQKNWPIVVAMNRIGMVFVFFHALKLGQHLQSGWLKGVWLFYGVTLLAYFIWAYNREFRSSTNK